MARVAGGMPVPPTVGPRPTFVIVAEDAFSPPRHPEGQVIAPRFPPVVGPRPAFVLTSEDVLSYRRHPEAWVLGGQANAPVTPPSLRPVVIGMATEPPLPFPNSLVMEGAPHGVVPGLRPILYVPAAEPPLPDAPPVRASIQPNAPVTPRSLRPVTMGVPTEPPLPNAPPVQVGAQPRGTPPIPPFRPLTWSSDEFLPPAPGPIQLGGKPSKAVTPPSLRMITTGSQELPLPDPGLVIRVVVPITSIPIWQPMHITFPDPVPPTGEAMVITPRARPTVGPRPPTLVRPEETPIGGQARVITAPAKPAVGPRPVIWVPPELYFLQGGDARILAIRTSPPAIGKPYQQVKVVPAEDTVSPAAWGKGTVSFSIVLSFPRLAYFEAGCGIQPWFGEIQPEA
jgi:hypothetical protein